VVHTLLRLRATAVRHCRRSHTTRRTPAQDHTRWLLRRSPRCSDSLHPFVDVTSSTNLARSDRAEARRVRGPAVSADRMGSLQGGPSLCDSAHGGTGNEDPTLDPDAVADRWPAALLDALVFTSSASSCSLHQSHTGRLERYTRAVADANGAALSGCRTYCVGFVLSRASNLSSRPRRALVGWAARSRRLQSSTTTPHGTSSCNFPQRRRTLPADGVLSVRCLPGHLPPRRPGAPPSGRAGCRGARPTTRSLT